MGTGQGSGLQIEGRFGHLWTVSDGRILRFAWFRSYDEALAAGQRTVLSGRLI